MHKDFHMDFKAELLKAADACVESQNRTANHLIRQAFFDGVRFYMDYVRAQQQTPPPPPPAVS